MSFQKKGDRLVKWGQHQAFAEFQPTLSEVEEEALKMFSVDDGKIFVRLLEDAKSRVFSDYENAKGRRLKAFCLALMRGLTDSGLEIGKTLTATGLGHNYYYEFRRLTGMSPRAYMEHHRLRLGQSILRHIDPHIYIAAYAAGYSGLSPFSRAYSRRMGYPPSEEPNAEPDETRALIEGMPYDLISACRPDPRVSTNTAEETIAHAIGPDMESFWEEASGMSRGDLKGYMYRHANAISVTHFYFLIEKAKYEGRLDRDRGVELAHSALDALHLVEYWSGTLYTDERTFGCAVIGNHYRLKFNLEESERWFQQAMRSLPAEPDEKPLLFAEVNQLRVSLLWYRRRAGEAIKLFNLVLPIIREHGSCELLARTLQLGGEIYDSSGFTDRAIPLFLEATGLARVIDDPYVVFSAHFNLAYFYTRMGRAAEAAAQYEEVEKLKSTVEISPSHLTGLQGAVHWVNKQYGFAESCYLEAREGFIAQGLELYAALSSLELSLIFLEQDKMPEAFSTATGTINTVSRFSCHKEGISALAVLQEAAKAQKIDTAAVRKALQHLESIRKDPTSKLLLLCQNRGRA